MIVGCWFVKLNNGNWKFKIESSLYHLQKATPWLSVPQFGDWDQKGGALPDYSMDFSKIREMRKQNKRDPSRASLGNEEELISSATSNSNNAHSDEHDQFHQNHSPATRRSFFSYFNCCVKAWSIYIYIYIYMLGGSLWCCILLDYLCDYICYHLGNGKLDKNTPSSEIGVCCCWWWSFDEKKKKMLYDDMISWV